MRAPIPSPSTASRRLSGLAVLALTALGVAGCGLQIPTDPDGTEAAVRGGTLRVGITDNPPWTDIDGAGEPAGTEAELAAKLAAELDAEVQWSTGSEASLVDDLERGQLDLVVGGFLDDTPWSEKAAVTRWYTESQSEGGERERHVMLVRMGENRFLVTVESFLDGVAP